MKQPNIWGALALVACVATLTACPKEPLPPQPDADSGIDSGVVDSGDGDVDAAAPATCANWCKHAKKLGCPSAKPTPQGSTCEEVCSFVQTSGIKAATWDLKCRIGARSCAAADNCENK